MNRKVLTAMFALIAVITLVGAGALFVLANVDKQGEEASIDDVLKASVDIPEVTTNLLSGDFIRVAFKIQTDSKDTKEEIEKRDFQINNIIIKELSNMNAEDFEGSEGKVKFEKSLQAKMNKILDSGEVELVYITSLILQ